MNWTEKLERARRAHEWSRADIAKALECDPRTVDRWVSGDGEPRLSQTKGLLQLFDATYEQLFCDDVPLPLPTNTAEIDAGKLRLERLIEDGLGDETQAITPPHSSEPDQDSTEQLTAAEERIVDAITSAVTDTVREELAKRAKKPGHGAPGKSA